jgi:hypothetical protein
VPNAGFPGPVSVNGTRVAIINVSDAGGEVGPIENGPVYIRSASTGDPVATITPVGFPLAIALGRKRVALTVGKADGTRQLELYDADTGAPVSSIVLSTEAGARLDLDQGRVVYHRGRVIKIFAEGRSQVLAFAAATPIGLSIEARRVTWAENVGGRGRIRSVVIDPLS